ncbi:MAG: flagellar hook-basal body complex protein, partial [Planctomycetota bacterium]
LTTTAGQLLDPPITIPEDAEDLIIERDGTVLSLDAEGVTTELGQLELTRFRNPAGLLAIGDNLYVKGPNSGDEISGTAGEQGFGSLIQGALESSTVDPSTEITNQIVNQRYYQMNLRSFQTSDAIISRTLDLFS